jgi:hypothetical protein
MDTASPLVDDLKLLEDGLKMYDVEYDENILVYAPVLFITGDNVRHAEIICHKGSRATCPCRKCYWQLDPVQPRNTPVQPVHTSVVHYIAEPRLKHHIVQFAVDRLPRLPFPGVALKNRGRGANRDPNKSTSIMESSWDNLGYKLTGGEVFLKLKSFDPTKDTPVEMLHVVLLGITKYVFHIAAGNFLSADMIKALENGFRSYDSKAFNRKLNSSMRLYRSFLGRDFKIMVQVLPLVLNDALGFVAFASLRDNENGQVIFQALFNCFEKLGEVSSLLYLEKIRNNFDSYLLLLQSTVSELVDAIDTLLHLKEETLILQLWKTA